jgi:uncharacterized protein (TIGR02996 family)
VDCGWRTAAAFMSSLVLRKKNQRGVMNQREALLCDVIERPDDDVPRLRYAADWLDAGVHSRCWIRDDSPAAALTAFCGLEFPNVYFWT